jgi:hypothetical protein
VAAGAISFNEVSAVDDVPGKLGQFTVLVKSGRGYDFDEGTTGQGWVQFLRTVIGVNAAPAAGTVASTADKPGLLFRKSESTPQTSVSNDPSNAVPSLQRSIMKAEDAVDKTSLSLRDSAIPSNSDEITAIRPLVTSSIAFQNESSPAPSSTDKFHRRTDAPVSVTTIRGNKQIASPTADGEEFIPLAPSDLATEFGLNVSADGQYFSVCVCVRVCVCVCVCVCVYSGI